MRIKLKVDINSKKWMIYLRALNSREVSTIMRRSPKLRRQLENHLNVPQIKQKSITGENVYH